MRLIQDSFPTFFTSKVVLFTFRWDICEKLEKKIFAWAAPVRAPENLIQPLFDPARGADTLLRPNFRNP
jgi:hypothetical protein